MDTAVEDELEEYQGVHTGKHPVELDCYTLSTRAIVELANDIRQWIKRKVRGGIIYGRPRIGKSQAIGYLMNSMAQIIGNPIATFRFNCTAQRVKMNERDFFTDFLKDCGYLLPHVGTANDKRHNLIDLMISEAQKKGDPRIVLFIDEGQLLNELHYNLLISIHNKIELEGFRLYTFLFGQPELYSVKVGFREPGSEAGQIIGRFMLVEHQFRGIQKKSDIKYALSRYDLPVETKDHVLIPFTQYFFTKAYNQGWRLESQTDLIWDGFQKVRSQYAIHGPVNIPMAPFTALVDAILLTGSKTDPNPKITSDSIRQLIEEVRYLEYERSLPIEPAKA